MHDRLCQNWLLIEATGDAREGRRVAHDLLAGLGRRSGDLTLAQLLLTAACLHVDASMDGPTLEDVIHDLQRLSHGAAAACAWVESASQLVRYAAAELEDLPLPDRRRLIDQLVQALQAACR